nr:symmetrical bis(5'-nucleosyl)-tetraphosphatase [Oceanococcus sp. HetDA_MAG_MS8]
MSVFVFGDLQGCASELQSLVDQLPLQAQDELWFCGDLINRGPDSMGTLQWLWDHRARIRCVLGNHDLSVLARLHDPQRKMGSTASELAAHGMGSQWVAWLLGMPLIQVGAGLSMVHAGIPPDWDLELALQSAEEVSAQLRATPPAEFWQQLYGNTPQRWTSELRGMERTRYTVNALTRMRFVESDGALEFACKSSPEQAPKHLQPWFSYSRRRWTAGDIAFGHWSTLGQVHWPQFSVWGLDEGCVWGGHLTALQWPERRLFRQPSPGYQEPGD